MYDVIVLKEGYSIKEGPGQQKACGSITLLKGPHNIIVDTGNPWDKDLILEGLSMRGVAPEDVNYVVCTQSHGDKVGNLNVFPRATSIIAGNIGRGDRYLHHGFAEGIPYEIDDDVEVVSTPGHTGADVSVLVKNTKQGTVAITGDLFECDADLEDFTLWQENSEDPELQQQNRLEVLKVADWIVPGHGPMFKVPDEYKKQLRMVMFYEHRTYDGPDGSHSETSYTVVEDD